MIKCNCGREFAGTAGMLAHRRVCKLGEAVPAAEGRPAAWVTEFAASDDAQPQAPQTARPAPPPPPPPPQADAIAYIGQIPLPQGERAPTRETEADDAQQQAEHQPEPQQAPPEPPAPAPAAPSGGVSIARMIGVAIDSHFGDIKRLDADERAVIAATFPDVPMQGGKGILLVLFGILLPRIIEHPTYRAAIGAGFDRLGAWVRRLFRTREQVEAERAAAATERAAQPAEPTEAEIEAAHLAQIERDREKAAAEQRAREKADKAKIDHWNRTFADTGEA